MGHMHQRSSATTYQQVRPRGVSLSRGKWHGQPSGVPQPKELTIDASLSRLASRNLTQPCVCAVPLVGLHVAPSVQDHDPFRFLALMLPGSLQTSR